MQFPSTPASLLYSLHSHSNPDSGTRELAGMATESQAVKVQSLIQRGEFCSQRVLPLYWLA